MPDYSREDVRQAERIVAGLLSDQAEVPQIEAPIAVSDIEADAADFNSDLAMLEVIGADAPAVRLDEELVPVALSLIMGPGWSWPPFISPLRRRWRHPFMYEWLHELLRFESEEGYLRSGFENISRDQARATFFRRAVDFLATRIGAVRDQDSPAGRWFGGTFLFLPQRIGGPRVATPGCNFSVSTNSRGLRVFWSGAYRVSPNYFSHPTTPAIGVLQSGTYVFGVDGGAYGNTVQWDTNAVVSLPGIPHVHLNF
jgi:hypothetical protein